MNGLEEEKKTRCFLGGLEPGFNVAYGVDLENNFLNPRAFKVPSSLLQARSHLFRKESTTSSREMNGKQVNRWKK